MTQINNWVLDRPTPLCQLQLYKGTEGMFACWATCAEMIVKWKSKYSFFARPSFEDYLDGSDGQSQAEYLNFIFDWLSAWGFEVQIEGNHGVWSPQTLATLLKNKGPLLCIGSFGTSGWSQDVKTGDLAHAICVYGYTEKFGGVYYIDPMDADTKQMSLNLFRQKIWSGYHSVYARVPNYR